MHGGARFESERDRDDGPLEGLRILDITSVLMGPFATRIFGDPGAEIVKVEPLGGDDARFAGRSRRQGMESNLDAPYAIVGDALLQRTTDEWPGVLNGADSPAMPLHSIESLLRDPHQTETGFLGTMEHPTEGDNKLVGDAALSRRSGSEAR